MGDFRCPRRPGYMPASVRSLMNETEDAKVAHDDSWVPDDDGVLCCTHCGSIHPDVFLQHCRDRTGTIIPADKSYRCRLYVTLTDEQIADRKTAWIVGPLAAALRRTIPDVDLEKHWAESELHHTLGDPIGVFFFQHLTDRHGQEFTRLLNERKLVFGFPYRFVVIPFFLGTDPD